MFHVRGYEAEEPVALAAAGTLLRELDAFSLEQTTVPLEPLRLFEAAFQALPSTGPALLALDDVQWVDELSLALCHYLVRGSIDTGPPLAVLAAFRPSPRADSFQRSLEHALPTPVAVIELGGLTREEGVAFAHSLDSDLDLQRQSSFGRGPKGPRSGSRPLFECRMLRTRPVSS